MEHIYQPFDSKFSKMPWNEIDNVVFDLGNVLLKFDAEEIMKRVFPGEEEKYQDFRDYVFRSPVWAMLDRGSISPEEGAKYAAANTPLDEKDVLRLFREASLLDETIPEGMRVLEMCKAKGKKCFVLSNYPEKPFEYVRKKHEFFSLFDGLAVSSHLKMMKPDHEIFLKMLEMFGIDGERTLFIDDSFPNVEGAMWCGIQGICFNAPGKLKKFFEE